MTEIDKLIEKYEQKSKVLLEIAQNKYLSEDVSHNAMSSRRFVRELINDSKNLKPCHK